jgi:hypothetical protein
MPAHDWSRESAGTFHHFHTAWITELAKALNNGVLPASFYALAEQKAGRIGPDVLTLQSNSSDSQNPSADMLGATPIASAPPKVRFAATAEPNEYLKKQRTLVIRHTSNDRIVALIEILSPGNKNSRKTLQDVVKKVLTALRRGYHVLLVDVLPPGPGDPQGIHGAVWAKIARPLFVAPPDKPLTLVAYVASNPIEAYVEPLAVGDKLSPMPLFLSPDWYVLVPLEETYAAAWTTLPRQVRASLSSTAGPSQ